MFLATTALSEFWDCDEELLFISSTCLLYSEKHKWSKLNYQILPCPWDDRQRFYEAAEYLDKLTDKFLATLIDYLNAVHNTQFPRKYWMLIIGYWLVMYMHPLYDRYTLLKDVYSQHPELNTVTLDSRCFVTPYDVRDHTELVLNDYYNLQLFSQLLSGLGYSFTSRMVKNPRRYGISHADLRKASVDSSAIVTIKIKPQVMLGSLYCDSAMLHGIIENAGGLAYPCSSSNQPFTYDQPVFNSLRLGLNSLPASNEFERLFVKTLPQNFPSLYLEGFSSARLNSLRQFENIPSVLISLNDWYTNESFKFLAAEASCHGSRLVTGDHGGGWGFMKTSSFNFYDEKFADAIVACGWVSCFRKGYLKLPSLYTSSLLNKLNQRNYVHKLSMILFVGTACPRYLLRFDTSPVAGQLHDYLLWEFTFLECLPESLLKFVLCRPHRNDFYGFSVKQRLVDRFPGLDIEFDWQVSFRQRLSECRIYVVDHPSSTYMEALASNVPSVMFWSPYRWEVSDDAEPYFDELRQVGILWDTPEAAAAHVASIYDDPWAWWGQPEVQQVRQQFVDRFALAREDWCEQWTQALLDELILSCQSWLEREPDNPEPMNGISQAYLRKGDASKALESCQQTLAQHPDNAEAHRILGSVLAAQGNNRQAYQAYQAALERDPNLVAAHLELAEVCDRLGHPTEARDHRYQAYTLEPSTATSQEYYELGIDFQQSGDRERAADCYRQAIALDPSLARAYLRLGRSLAGQGKLGSALRWYSKAVLLKLRYQLGL